MLSHKFRHSTRYLTTKFFLISAGFVAPVLAQDYIAPPMVNIPAGSFMMGAEGGDPATLPIHKVTVDAFQMSKYAVTVAEFSKFAKDTGYTREATCNDYIDNEGLRGPTHIGSGRWDKHRHSYSEYQPVVCISWQDANAYADWLSQKTGQQYRLPTEQEWEYAAKANTTTRYFWGDDPNMTQACSYGNFADYTGEYTNNTLHGLSNVGWIGHLNCDDGEAYNAIVGLYRPNPFGLFDMLGNVSELVNACYNENGYQVEGKESDDLNSCEFLVHRGGNWHYPADPSSTRNRYKREGWNVGTDIGFRLAIGGHGNVIEASAIEFETKLKQAQSEHLANRPELLPAPQSVQLAPLKNGEFTLSWQPSSDASVTSYEIYRSKSGYAHFYSGYFQKHYDKLKTVPANKHTANVKLPQKGGSFRVVAISENQTSLPSEKAIHFVQPSDVTLPGRIKMQDAIALENIPLYHFSAKDDKPESYILFKTNKDSDKSAVTATFKVDVKKSGWYQLNYRGNTFHKGEFFRLWQGNSLAGVIDYDAEIDDKTSDRHKVYLQQGKHELQLSVLREKFDRWGLAWLEFTELKS